MKIKKEKKLNYDYSLEFDYRREVIDYCKHLSSSFGFQNISFFDKKWRINDINIVVQLKKRFPEIIIDNEMALDYELADYLSSQSVLDRENSERIKRSLDSSLDVQNIKGELRSYQKVGVEFFLANNGTAINSDPMGSGKSFQSIAYAAHSNFDKVFVVCPSSVKYNWENEVKKFTHMTPFVINGKTKKEELNEGYDNSNFIIINYDILKKFAAEIIVKKWDLMILDECHMIKNSKAQRTKIIKKLASVMPRRILLSGTPFLSRPSELFNSLYLVDPRTWNNYYSYTKRYCDGFRDSYGWNDRGASNIEELQDKISKYFIRRQKKDILPELPEKTFIDYLVDLSPDIQKQYDLAEREFSKFLVEVKKKNKKEIKKALQAEKLVKLGALRNLTSKGKIGAAKEIVQNIIDGNEKVLVFSCYNEPLEELEKEFGDKTVMITGKIDSKKRNDLVNEFQNNENKKIFLGGMKSAGVGINLTAASNVLFIDFSWVPADHAQAIDRAHRIGSKTDKITIYQLYSRGTIDEYMHKILNKKQILFDCLVEGSCLDLARKNYTSTIMNKIEKKY